MKSLKTNVDATGIESDLPHGVLIAAAAPVDSNTFIRAENGSSATGNSTNVVYVSGADLRRTYCVREAPDLEEGKVPKVERGALELHAGTGYRASGHCLGEHLKVKVRKDGPATRARPQRGGRATFEIGR